MLNLNEIIKIRELVKECEGDKDILMNDFYMNDSGNWMDGKWDEYNILKVWNGLILCDKLLGKYYGINDLLWGFSFNDFINENDFNKGELV